jgi:hypothetical protein
MSPITLNPASSAAPADVVPAASPPAAAPKDISQRVGLAQATMLFELSSRPVVAGAVFSLLVGVLLWSTLAGPRLLAWVVARVVISLVRVWDCRDFMRHPPSAQELPPRWRRFMLLMVCESSSWSAMGLLFASAAPPQTELVLLAGLVAVAAVSVFSLGSDFRACGTLVSVVLLPNTIHQLNRGTPESLVAGGGMMILLVLLLIESAGLSKRIGELLRLRHENAAIAEERQRALLLAEHSNQAKSRFLASAWRN